MAKQRINLPEILECAIHLRHAFPVVGVLLLPLQREQFERLQRGIHPVFHLKLRLGHFAEHPRAGLMLEHRPLE